MKVEVKYFDSDNLWMISVGDDLAFSIYPQVNRLYDAVEEDTLPPDIYALWVQSKLQYSVACTMLV